MTDVKKAMLDSIRAELVSEDIPDGPYISHEDDVVNWVAETAMDLINDHLEGMVIVPAGVEMWRDLAIGETAVHGDRVAHNGHVYGRYDELEVSEKTPLIQRRVT